MAFDKKKFMGAQFSAREEKVAVPALKDWFAEGDEPVWTVRGLTGEEMGRVRETVDRNKLIHSVLDGLAAKSPEDVRKFVADLAGAGKNTPDDVAKRLEMLCLGSVDPVCDMELSIKLCRTFPGEHYVLTTKVMELSGLGHVPGKAKASGSAKT